MRIQKILKNVLLLMGIFVLYSCLDGGKVKVLEREVAAKHDNGGTTTAEYAFTTSATSSSSAIAGTSRTLTLSYSETANKLAKTCEISTLIKLDIDTACTCDVAGVCSVVIKGATGGIGASSFDFRVGADGEFSNWSTLSYNQLCPTGYIEVPANSAVDANNSFCVMQTEAKDVMGYPASTASGFPIDSVNIVTAKASCESLNTLNTVTAKYDLIANQEWMAIARNIESNAVNWSNGVISTSNELARGHSDNTPANALDISDMNDPYDQTGNSVLDMPSLGWEHRRTHTLDNGNVIWDFAGNVWEWTDLSLATGLQTLTPSLKPYSSGDGSAVSGYRELNVIDTMIGENVGDVFLPKMWQPSNTAYDHAQGVGQYYADVDSSGGTLVRGGAYYNGNRSGIYGFTLDSDNTSSGTWAGFRCVYRP